MAMSCREAKHHVIIMAASIILIIKLYVFMEKSAITLVGRLIIHFLIDFYYENKRPVYMHQTYFALMAWA
jgi:hypothetical protein